jgi:hypothetical protein
VLLDVDSSSTVKLGSITYGNVGQFVAINYERFIEQKWVLGPQTVKRLAEQKALRQFDKDLEDLLKDD